MRISGPRARLATRLAKVLDRGYKSSGPEADFVFENGQPTSGFEPLTRCLQIRHRPFLTGFPQFVYPARMGELAADWNLSPRLASAFRCLSLETRPRVDYYH